MSLRGMRTITEILLLHLLDGLGMQCQQVIIEDLEVLQQELHGRLESSLFTRLDFGVALSGV